MKVNSLFRSLLIGAALPAAAFAQQAEPPALLSANGEPVVAPASYVYVTEFQILNILMGDRKSALELLQAKYGPLTDEGVKRLTSAKGVKVLGAPKIVTEPGQKASVTVGKIAPQYFERAGKVYRPSRVAVSKVEGFQEVRDVYRLRQLDGDDAPGLFLDVSVTPFETNPHTTARLDVRVRITIVKDRVELLDVHLDVGQPILSSKVVEASVEARLNSWMLLKTVELEDPKPGWSNAFFVIARVARREARPRVAGKSLDEELDLLNAKSDSMERTSDGSLVRLIGNVTLTLSDQTLERPDGTIQSTDQILKAQRVEIRKMDSPMDAGVRAKRMDFDAAAGAIVLTGDVEIAHKDILIKADSAFLFQDRLIAVHVSAAGRD